MPFVSDILRYRSLSIVGLAKNTGKTETLNYVLRRLPCDVALAVTSIGTDGERRDLVTGGAKPEITLRAGPIFSTAEKYYAQRRVVSEILDVGRDNSAVGRIITARTQSEGEVILSGAPSSTAMVRWIDMVGQYGAQLTIIDGALSRMSSASPAIGEAMILATGAARSANMNTLVRETAYAVELIRLPLADNGLRANLYDLEGTWTIDGEETLHKIDAPTSLGGLSWEYLKNCRTLYLSGALTDSLLKTLSGSDKSVEIIVKDFTHIFATSQTYGEFKRRGGRLSVLRRSNLLALTLNPIAENGMVFDSDMLRERLMRATDLAVYDIVKGQ